MRDNLKSITGLKCVMGLIKYIWSGDRHKILTKEAIEKGQYLNGTLVILSVRWWLVSLWLRQSSVRRSTCNRLLDNKSLLG